MLTRKQFELLRFINERLKESGVPPSFDEMKDALDLKSKSGIHRLITALVERGFIRRLPHRARAIEVIKLPENEVAQTQKRMGFQPSVIEGSGPPKVNVSPPPSERRGARGLRSEERSPPRLGAGGVGHCSGHGPIAHYQQPTAEPERVKTAIRHLVCSS